MTSAPHTSRRVIADACPLCDAVSWTVLVDGGPSGFEWVRCSCAAVFKRAEPADAADQAIPASTMGDGGQGGAASATDRSTASSVTGTGAGNIASLGDVADERHYDEQYFGRYARRRRRRVAKARRQILDALEATSPGRLLDVGCSLGYTLEAARSLGLEATGVDLASHAIDECRRLGFDAHRGTLDALPFDDASFAIAMLKHVFEHTPTPRRTLAELRRVLIPGAALFLAVPNGDYFKAVRSPATSRFFRGEAARAHFVYYTPVTLSRLVEEEGFCVVGVHSRVLHRRGSVARMAAEVLALPLRLPLRALAAAAGLRKEFWLVAVRT